jgi:hypothetical protein
MTLVDLRQELLQMLDLDMRVRGELAADGSLFNGYHPLMERVHRENAARLREIIEVHGWPNVDLVGAQGAEAAWMIAQHSIGEPEFMRLCRDLLLSASSLGQVPKKHFAFIDDRIHVFEGKPQRFGTQLRGGPTGLEPCALEDPGNVDAWRREVGLPDLAEVLASSRSNPPPRAQSQSVQDAAELKWRRDMGWIQ